MKNSKSPFKRFSHSREGSTDDHGAFFHKRSVSGNSAHLNELGHSRSASTSGAPPVSGIKISHKRNISTSSKASQNSNFLAEQYERDRRAIIDCCFSANENKSHGFTNNYITHVRIIEDSKSPSSRPPIDSKLEYKKKRVLILSCKSGNPSDVQLHKGRENSEGIFQIGRTWELKELTKVERDTEINEGFMLTMGKRYYWETNSAKERTVFLKSLVNTFMQAFEGHVPELLNWDLSLFYLDEKSYQRAVIQKPSSTSKSIVPPGNASPVTPAALDEHKGNEAAMDKKLSQRQQISPDRNRKQEVTSQSSRPSNRQSPLYLNKAPYSNSPTIIEANKRYDTPVSYRSNSGLEGTDKTIPGAPVVSMATSVHSPQKPQPNNTKKETSESQQIEQKREIKHIVGQDYHINKSPVEEDRPKLYSSVPNKNDNLLENLNNVLGSNKNSSGEVANSLEEISFHPGEGTNDISSNAHYSTAKVESLNVPENHENLSDFERSGNFNATISDENLNDTIETMEDDKNENTYEDTFEDTNELSFEKGDEVRFSQLLEVENAHVYHEVSTIQEETTIPGQYKEKEVLGPEIQGDKAEKVADVSKMTWDINDEEMLEIFTDINWDFEDDANTLIEKLNTKKAEAEYTFNKGLLSLETLASSLTPFEENVNKECDNMNPILSLFLMEMGNVADDIEYVEGQKNGLQVESANKKQLWDTLTELMNTVSLDDNTLNQLLNSPVTEKNLTKMEEQLVTLFKALKAITGEKDKEGYDLGEMRALKQRRETYEKVTTIFLERLVNEMEGKFQNIGRGELSEDHLIQFLTKLLVFSSLTLFCKDISPESYNQLIEKWNISISLVYRRMGERVLKNLEKLSASAVKTESLTITNQPGLERLLAENIGGKDYTSDLPVQGFVLELGSTIEVLGRQCIFYQNFVESFFHVSSKLDFEQYTRQYSNPKLRHISLTEVRTLQSDRESAQKELQLVSKIFQPIMTQLSIFQMNVLKHDKSLAPGLMLILEHKVRKLESSNAEFLISVFSRLFVQVQQLWLDYVDEEIVYMQRINMNFSSRIIFPIVMGLTVFIKNCRELIISLHTKLDIQDIDTYESLGFLEDASRKLSHMIVNSLDKKSNIQNMAVSENQSSMAGSPGVDKTITLLMNSDWLFEILSSFNNKSTFDTVLQTSKQIFDREKDVYAVHLLRDSMPKLTSFVSGVTNLVSSAGTADPSHWAAYSRNNLENILAGYSSHEIEVLVKRLHDHMEAHFVNEPCAKLREGICDKLWSCLQGHTVSLYLKLYTLIERHYKGTYVKFTKNDIITAFESYKS